jgi:hypothetical protein
VLFQCIVYLRTPVLQWLAYILTMMSALNDFRAKYHGHAYHVRDSFCCPARAITATT